MSEEDGRRQRLLTRYGVSAGGSVLIAVGLSLLTNIVTSSPRLPVVVGLATLVLGAVGFEIWRHAKDAGHSVHPPIPAQATPRDLRHRSIAPRWGLLPGHVRGRDDLVEQLTALTAQPDGQFHVLCGLGGCGKTTVALQVGRNASLAGMTVWWLNARDEPSLQSDLLQLMVELGADPLETARVQAGEQSLLDLVWGLLSAASAPWLLIIDNADEPRLLAAAGGAASDANGVARGSTHGLVIVTSRDTNAAAWGTRACCHVLGNLSDDAGALMLIDLAGRDAGTDDDARALAQRLGGLALAIRTAGRYIASAAARLNGLASFSGYQAALNDKFAQLLGSGQPGLRDDEQRLNVMATWELSLDLLRRQRIPAARELMRLFGVLSASPVPADLLDTRLLASSPVLGGPDPHAWWPVRLLTRSWWALTAGSRSRGRYHYDAAAHTQTVAALCDLALLDLTSTDGGHPINCLTAHPMVVETNRQLLYLDPKLRRGAAITAVKLVNAGAVGRDSSVDEAAWWSYLAPHVGEILAHQKAVLPTRAAKQLFAAATAVRENLHLVLDAPGWESETATEYRQLLRMEEQLLGRDNPGVKATRRRLAEVLVRLGMYEDALAEYQIILSKESTSPPGSSAQLVATRKATAALLLVLKRYDEAHQQYRLALAEEERVLGPDHRDSLATRRHIADLLVRQENVEEARNAFRQLLDLVRSSPSCDDQDIRAVRSAIDALTA